ncbi:MAG: cupin domain-containing protein [Thermodesulfobacteriota bacterium]
MLIENEKVKKVQMMGFVQQTLAGEQQGLKTLEVWLLTLPPGSETPVNQHFGEVVVITLKGNGHVIVDENRVDLFPDTTLVIPPQVTRQAVNTGKEDLVILIIRSLVRPPEKAMMEIMGKRR